MKTLYKKLSPYAWILLIVAFAPMLLKQAVPDTDTYFLAATGRYIVQNGTIPDTNPFIIHDGFTIIVQQWLFDVLMYGIFTPFGNAGLMTYVCTMFAITITLFYCYTGCFSHNKFARATCTLVAAFIFVSFIVPRPTSISMPCLIFELICLEKYHKKQQLRWLAALLPISLILINTHATMWVMMFVLMLPYVFPYVDASVKGLKNNIKCWWFEHHKHIVTAFLMFAIGFCNPYGFDGMMYVIKSYGSATFIPIQELASPTMFSMFGAMAFVGVVFLGFYCARLFKNIPKERNSRKIRRDFTTLYLALGTLFMLCKHLRNLWYFIIGIVPVVLKVWGDFSPPALSSKEKSSLKCTLIMCTAICLTAAIAFVGIYGATWSPMASVDSQYTPIAAADYLDTQNGKITLYNDFGNGAYMEWRGYQVYIDARPELFAKNINGQFDVLEEYAQLQKNELDYNEFINKYQFTHLIIDDNSLFDMFMSQQSNYTCVIDGPGYNLYQPLTKGN